MNTDKINLAGSLEYQANAIVSRELLKQANGKIMIFAFDDGEELSEHTAPFDAFVTVLDGSATIKVGGKPFELSQGESIIMPAQIPHALSAKGRFKMLLCMIRA